MAAAAVLFALSGCMGGAVVKKDGIAAANRIAVVSIVMPRIADTDRDGNRAVLQGFVDRDLVRIEADLRSVRNWTVVEATDYKGSPEVMSIARISDDDIAALRPTGEKAVDARGAIAQELAGWKGTYLGARSLPVVPHSGLVPNRGDKSAVSLIPHIMQKHAAWLCRVLNVDAVVFVHVAANIDHPRPKTYLVSGNRTDGAVHVAQTMVIIDQKGRIIADMGRPLLDGHARTKDLLPLYAGSGQSAVQPKNIDLADPDKKIVNAFSSLIDESSMDMIAALKKAVQEEPKK